MALAGALTRFGNDLYTGDRSVPFIGRRRIWLTIAAVLVALSALVPFIRGGGDYLAGFNFGIEFRGGSQFQVVVPGERDTDLAQQIVQDIVPDAVVHVTTGGESGIRIQTDQLTNEQTQEIAVALREGLATESVTSSFIGATWGADITRQGLIGLGVFLGLAALLMALYFRTWKMSMAAMLALLHDLIVTIGVYAAIGFEITPAAVIGFLTILGFSLYDTVVVFDKVRENLAEWAVESTRTFGETVNLAANQTLVRSINTGVVAALPTAAILFIGSFALGADTLRDISLALLVGTVVGTASTPFVAAPLYTLLREREPEIKARDTRTMAARERAVAVSA